MARVTPLNNSEAYRIPVGNYLLYLLIGPYKFPAQKS